MIDYHLGAAAQHVALEIRDAGGTLVRRFASDTPVTAPHATRYFTESWTRPPAQLAGAAGDHRFVWNLRTERPRAVHHDFGIAAVFAEGTPISPEGRLVAPGDYSVVLDVDGAVSRATLKIVADPRVTLDAGALHDATAFHADVAAALERNFVAYGELHAAEMQAAAARKQAGANKALQAALARFDAATQPLRSGDGETGINLGAIGETLSGMAADIEASDRAPTEPQRGVLAECNERMTRATALWQRVKLGELAALNTQLQGANMSAIAIPAADRISLDDTPESKDLP
jgi:hypothetical protein